MFNTTHNKIKQYTEKMEAWVLFKQQNMFDLATKFPSSLIDP